MNNAYEPLPFGGGGGGGGNDQFYTAPDHTPVPAVDTYYKPPSKEAASKEAASGGKDSSQLQSSAKNESLKSQKSQQQQDKNESTDLRSAEKIKSRAKAKNTPAPGPVKPSADDLYENVALLNNNNNKDDPEKQEETLRVQLRLQRFAQEQEKRAKRTKICIWIATGIIVLIGICLTALVPSIYFTECFGTCKGLK